MSEHILHLEFSLENRKQFGPCDCCGNITERVWGYINRDDVPAAAYFVEWTPGHSDSAANFDLIVGRWGEGVSSSDRAAISLEFRQVDDLPAFRVIDSSTRPVSKSTLVGAAMSRDEVLNGPLRETTFKLVDTIYLHDPRIGILRCPKS